MFVRDVWMCRMSSGSLVCSEKRLGSMEPTRALGEIRLLDCVAFGVLSKIGQTNRVSSSIFPRTALCQYLFALDNISKHQPLSSIMTAVH